MFPLFRPFLSKVKQDDLLKRLLNGDITNKLAQFTDEDRIVKYCPACFEHDRQIGNQPYLRRIHQIQGYLVCSLHHTRLVTLPVSSNPPAFFIDLTQLVDIAPDRVFPPFALDLARAIESIPNTFMDPFETTLLTLKERLRTKLGLNVKSINEIPHLLSQEVRAFLDFKDFPLFGFFKPEKCTKRINNRIFRIILLSCLIDQIEMSPVGRTSKTHRTSKTRRIRRTRSVPRKQKNPSHIPQSFACHNPTTACGEVPSKDNVKRQPKSRLLWVYRCPNCGFTFEAKLNKGTMSRIKLIDPGASLSTLIKELWDDSNCPWDALPEKTGLSESDLASYAFEQRLNLEGKPLSLIKRFNRLAMMESKRVGKLESTKAVVLDFIQRFPTADRKALISSKHAYYAYRYVRLLDPDWVAEHAVRFSVA